MSIHGGTRLDSKQAAKAIIFERRLLMCCTASVLLGVIIWVISISTEYWYVTSCKGGAYVNNTGMVEVGGGYLLYAHSGLWRTCRTLFTNSTSPPGEGNVVTVCRYLRVTSIPGQSGNSSYNVIIGYRRTCLGFSIISFLLLALAVFFSLYTFRVRRYTFKRVAACLHFLVAAVELVVIEVHVTSLHFQEFRHLSTFVSGCTWNYSFSFVLGWICFIINLMAGIGFLYTSTKKKKRADVAQGDAEDEFDDEPQIMGR